MKRERKRWMLAISGSVAFTLITAACGALGGPWTGAPAGTAAQYASPGTAASQQGLCDGGTAASALAACGPPWPRPW
jgi:hypothetical protein